MARITLSTSAKHHELTLNEAKDISHWQEIGTEASGAREKKILLRPNSKIQYLVKFPKYGPFEITTEIFNGILGNELNLNHVRYFPVRYRGRDAVACQSFLNDNEELWEMKELICRHSSIVSTESTFGRDVDVLREHHLENIALVLDAEFGSSILPKFFQMIGFDALIGHGDRHWSNYGAVISYANWLTKFAPLYDTASGYLTEISDPEALVEKLARDLKDPDWYRPKKRGLCKITLEGDIKVNHFDLLEHVIANPELKRYKPHLCQPFLAFREALPRTILNRFFPRLDSTRKKVIETILLSRWRIGKKVLSI